MSPGERVMMAFTAMACAGLLVGGIRSGVMTGEFEDYAIGGQPIRFALAVAGCGFGFAYCTLLAAGFSGQDVWNGLGWLVRWYSARFGP